MGILILAAYTLIALSLIYIERKVAAFFQARLGPNRLGKYGVIQSLADMIKILIKEVIQINKADKLLFYAAPFFVIVASVLAFGALPFGMNLHALDFNIGVFYLLAVSSLGIIGILLAGWSSNNKYSMISGHAETNRGPFDLPEAESELTAGYHTEYSGLQFGFFYLSEYLNMFIVAAVAATVFLGGWMPVQIKGWEAFNQVMWYIPSWAWFFGKAGLLMFFSLWVRWSFPRLRIDLLLNLEWKYLLPINLANLLVMVVIVLSGFTLTDLFPALFGK